MRRKFRHLPYRTREEGNAEGGEGSTSGREKFDRELRTAKCELAVIRRSIGTDEKSIPARESDDSSNNLAKESSPISEFKFHKRRSSQFDKFSKEKSELESQLDGVRARTWSTNALVLPRRKSDCTSRCVKSIKTSL